MHITVFKTYFLHTIIFRKKTKLKNQQKWQ